MKKPTFIQLNNIEDSIVSRLYNNLSTIFKALLSNPILFGNYIRVEVERNADQEITHGLGRLYKGLLIINKDNKGDVYISQSDNNRPDTVIIIKSTQNMIVDLYIF